LLQGQSTNKTTEKISTELFALFAVLCPGLQQGV
jgi:hypothetical protein